MIPSCKEIIISGISIRFQMLSQAKRQVLYALLTRPPPKSEDSSRLACVKHSVSVHPEPGSNSSFNLSQLSLFCFFTPFCVVCLLSFLFLCQGSFRSCGHLVSYHTSHVPSILFLKFFKNFKILEIRRSEEHTSE